MSATAAFLLGCLCGGTFCGLVMWSTMRKAQALTCRRQRR